MIGAILGDMIGAPYEFDRGGKTKDFPLWSKESTFTDDSVMTVAVAEALMNAQDQNMDDRETLEELTRAMRKWAAWFPYAGYGRMFCAWLSMEEPKPYGSYGNGSAMRVSAAGWLYDDLETTERMAALTASVSHNHPEGIKAAQATASAIYLAGVHGMDYIREYITRRYEYDLTRTCAELRPHNQHDETAMWTMPLVFAAFFESTSYEDAIRNAVSLGGDTDTIACITGSIAEAYYGGVPQEIINEGIRRMPLSFRKVIERFEKRRK